jgi:hypothetical protein
MLPTTDPPDTQPLEPLHQNFSLVLSPWNCPGTRLGQSDFGWGLPLVTTYAYDLLETY